MANADCVEHIGVVETIQNNVLKVKIKSVSACTACHAKGACSSFDIQDKLIDIRDSKANYKIGSQIIVVMNNRQGYLALFWGYIAPFILVISTLVVSTSITHNELLSGGFSLIILVPYYLILHLIKDRFNKKFQFRVKE